jgi:hypothetical protein
MRERVAREPHNGLDRVESGTVSDMVLQGHQAHVE